MTDLHRHPSGNASDYLNYVVARDLAARRDIASSRRLRRSLRRSRTRRRP